MTAVVIVLCLLFIVPVSVLAFVQLSNFLRGQTTNERFSKQAYQMESDTSNASGIRETEGRRSRISEGTRSLIRHSVQGSVRDKTRINNSGLPNGRRYKSNAGCLKMCTETQMKTQTEIYEEVTS